jgi:hypothetical protein
MVISNSRRDKTPEEREHDDAIDALQEQDDEREETILETQLGHIPGRLPGDQEQESSGAITFRSYEHIEISLDHATEAEWDEFLDLLDEEETDG